MVEKHRNLCSLSAVLDAAGRAARAARGRRTSPSCCPPRAGRPAAGAFGREDALRRLAQIAFGRANESALCSRTTRPSASWT